MSQPRTRHRRRKFNGQKPAADVLKQEGNQARVGYQPPEMDGLRVNAPNDPYEQEADRVADNVVNGLAGIHAPASVATPGVQRREDKQEPMAKPMIQRMEEEPAARPMIQRME
ncbi:MAG TPA: hypothetical protein DCR93_26495, partial [Cytophagales bacterium]|nr:hypothetical protein [Cytophagales bacterium]